MSDSLSGPGLLAGRVALVSGAGPGLGRATALELARHGADIALGARSADVLASVAADIESMGRRVVWQPTDITSIDECRALVERTVRELGRLDTLVNNAHLGGTGNLFAESYASDANDIWHRTIDTTLFGPLNMTRAAIDPMRLQGGGRVVMVGTMALREVKPNQGPYAVSKAALLQATRTLAQELGRDGIRVNMILPGYIRGAAVEAWILHQAAESERSVDEIEADLASTTSLGAIPTEAEIAGTIVWLASDLALPVTGQAIDVNAGQWM